MRALEGSNKCHRRGTVWGLTAILVWLCGPYIVPAVSQPTLAQPANQFTLPPLTESELDAFRDSLRAGHPFAPVNAEEQEDVDDAVSGMWAGSQTKVDSEVDSVVLRFSPQVDKLLEMSKSIDNPAATLLQSFEVQVSLRGRRFELRHSAGDRRSRGGFFMLTDQPGIERSQFVGGEEGSGLYVAVPPIADSDNGWGALLCPRAVLQVRRDRSSFLALGPSVYGLSEAKAIVSAKAEAKLSTGGGEGRARISVAVTSAFPAPNPDYDRAASALPQVDLFYNPQDRIPFFSLSGVPARQEGVRMLVEMQNAAGYVRRQYFLQAVSIQRIKEPPLTRVFVDNRDVETDEGECYVVIVRRHHWARYGREKALF